MDSITDYIAEQNRRKNDFVNHILKYAVDNKFTLREFNMVTSEVENRIDKYTVINQQKENDRTEC